MALKDFWTGFRLGIPIIISAGPFGVLFGALAVQHGMSVAEAVLMSATVYSGASQLVGLNLFGHDVPAWVIILSIFAVNFRHVLYSAALAPHVENFTPLQKAVNFFFLTDPHFAETERRAFSEGQVTFVWALGIGLAIYIPWNLLTFAGALLGPFIGDPKAIGLDVLLPIYFLGLLLGFRKRENWLPVVLASAVSSMVGLKLLGSPWHVSAGALVGILVAVLMPVKAPSAGEKTQEEII